MKENTQIQKISILAIITKSDKTVQHNCIFSEKISILAQITKVTNQTKISAQILKKLEIFGQYYKFIFSEWLTKLAKIRTKLQKR